MGTAEHQQDVDAKPARNARLQLKLVEAESLVLLREEGFKFRRSAEPFEVILVLDTM